MHVAVVVVVTAGVVVVTGSVVVVVDVVVVVGATVVVVTTPEQHLPGPPPFVTQQMFVWQLPFPLQGHPLGCFAPGFVEHGGVVVVVTDVTAWWACFPLPLAFLPPPF